jgi:hypothetical protein
VLRGAKDRHQATRNLIRDAVPQLDQAIDTGFDRPVRRVEKTHGVRALFDQGNPLLADYLLGRDTLGSWKDVRHRQPGFESGAQL